MTSEMKNRFKNFRVKTRHGGDIPFELFGGARARAIAESRGELEGMMGRVMVVVDPEDEGESLQVRIAGSRIGDLGETLVLYREITERGEEEDICGELSLDEARAQLVLEPVEEGPVDMRAWRDQKSGSDSEDESSEGGYGTASGGGGEEEEGYHSARSREEEGHAESDGPGSQLRGWYLAPGEDHQGDETHPQRAGLTLGGSLVPPPMQAEGPAGSQGEASEKWEGRTGTRRSRGGGSRGSGGSEGQKMRRRRNVDSRQ